MSLWLEGVRRGQRLLGLFFFLEKKLGGVCDPNLKLKFPGDQWESKSCQILDYSEYLDIYWFCFLLMSKLSVRELKHRLLICGKLVLYKTVLLWVFKHTGVSSRRLWAGGTVMNWSRRSRRILQLLKIEKHLGSGTRKHFSTWQWSSIKPNLRRSWKKWLKSFCDSAGLESDLEMCWLS